MAGTPESFWVSPSPGEAQFLPAQNEDDRAGDEDGHGEGEEHAAVVSDDNPQAREMRQDRAGHDAKGQKGSPDNRAWCEKENAGDQLGDAASDSPPRFEPEGAEDFDRFRGSGELEEQRLEKDAGGDDLEDPTGDGLKAVHGRQLGRFGFRFLTRFRGSQPLGIWPKVVGRSSRGGGGGVTRFASRLTRSQLPWAV